MSYHLEGRPLEVCNCRVLCPCWIGEDPDFGTCDSIVAWHIDKGAVDDVDVGGCTIAAVCHIPGNVLQGNWTSRNGRRGGSRSHRRQFSAASRSCSPAARAGKPRRRRSVRPTRGNERAGRRPLYVRKPALNRVRAFRHSGAIRPPSRAPVQWPR
nr:DUF1326 domain-containing protein [Burkholderia ubonensis]